MFVVGLPCNASEAPSETTPQPMHFIQKHLHINFTLHHCANTSNHFSETLGRKGLQLGMLFYESLVRKDIKCYPKPFRSCGVMSVLIVTTTLKCGVEANARVTYIVTESSIGLLRR